MSWLGTMIGRPFAGDGALPEANLWARDRGEAGLPP